MGIKQLPKPQTGVAEVDRVLAEHVDKLNPILRALPQVADGQLVQSTWIPITAFLNGWSSYTAIDSLFQGPAYMVDSMGFVHLRGLIRNAAGQAANIVAFVLPVHPAKQECFWGTTEGLGVGCRIDVTANGSVLPSVNFTVAAGGFRSLAGITFDTRAQ